MALYEYHCESCSREFELRRPVAQANAPLECPECHSPTVTRKLSLFMTTGKSERTGNLSVMTGAGGCACGGSCACGGHSAN